MRDIYELTEDVTITIPKGTRVMPYPRYGRTEQVWEFRETLHLPESAKLLPKPLITTPVGDMIVDFPYVVVYTQPTYSRKSGDGTRRQTLRGWLPQHSMGSHVTFASPGAVHHQTRHVRIADIVSIEAAP